MAKYYRRYAILFILGILALICVDFVQMYLPEFLGKVVNILDGKAALEVEPIV
ncbi:MAG: hypothetical protein HUJ59_02380, partial [Bacilli bacterium]|nr:hypothetical protein [Bacilli bacterium]